MLQIAFNKEDREKEITALAKTSIDSKSVVEEVVKPDETHSVTQVELDNTLAEPIFVRVYIVRRV
jgi:seryl-tRNA synthetase